MTVFDYPRVNFSGTLTLNPATANNCDYANAFVLPPGLGARVGQALGLIDSKLVRAITYGMDDETFRAWVQKAQTFNSVGNDPQPAQIVPAEWNYYGDLGTSLKAQVVGVTTGPGTTYTEPESGVPVTQLLGAALTSAGGHITDVNSEGSPPATQFFIDQVTLAGGGTPSRRARPPRVPASGCSSTGTSTSPPTGARAGTSTTSSGATRAPCPASTTRASSASCSATTCSGSRRARPPTPVSRPSTRSGTKPGPGRDRGHDRPAVRRRDHPDDAGRTAPREQQPQHQDAGDEQQRWGADSLGPAVLRDEGSTVAADFLGTFPDNFQPGPPATNPKFDFGPVALV